MIDTIQDFHAKLFDKITPILTIILLIFGYLMLFLMLSYCIYNILLLLWGLL